MINDDALRVMTPAERSDLARRLAELGDAAVEITPRVRRKRRLFTTYVLAAGIFLIPWTVFLAFTLPKHFLTGHWTATWVGFDIVLVASLAFTVWATLRRRQIVIFGAIVTATLLLVDVWFDVFTAAPRNDVLVSLATGLVGNIPLAVVLLMVAHRLVKTSAQHARELAGQDPDVPVRRLPLYYVDE